MEEIAGGDSHTRDMGIGLSSEITAHFSGAGWALPKMSPSTHGLSARSISSTFESPSSNWSLGTYILCISQHVTCVFTSVIISYVRDC